MPTPTTYTYPLPASIPNSPSVDLGRLEYEIEQSTIVTQIDPNGALQIYNGALAIKFKDVLSQGDKTTLDGGLTQVEESPALVGSILAQAGLEIPLADEEIQNTRLAAVAADLAAPDGSLRVADRDFVLGNTRFLRTDDGGQQMALDGLPAGASLVVWNGTGGGDTGGDWTAPAVGVESAAAAQSGTNGWDTQAQGSNTDVTFDNGSELDVAGTYDVLSFWLQPKHYPNNGNLQIQWKNAAGTVIGTTLSVENYVVNMDVDVWQQVSIPVSDFNLGADVQRCVFVLKTGNNQRHFIDNIELQASGGSGPYTFQVAAPAQEGWHATMVVLVVSAPDTGWSSSTFANQPGLANGLLLRQRRLSDGMVRWTLNAKDNVDLFGRYHPQESFNFDNNELLVGFMVKPGQSADIVITDDEVLEFVVRDDLSGLMNLRAFVHYGVETL